MSLCKLMVMDFGKELDWEEWNIQYKLNELPYDEYDLIKGIDYAEGLIDLGYIEEPFYEYNLSEFIEWANERIKELKKT